MEPWIILVCLVAILIGFLSSPVARQLRIARHLPGPIALPILGNVFQLAGTQAQLFANIENMYYKYDSIFRVWFFHKLLIMVRSPSAAKTLLTHKTSMERISFYNFLHVYLGNGLVSAPAQVALKMKKELLYLFSTKALTTYIGYFNDGAIKLCDILETKVGSESFSAHSLATRVTLETVLRIMFQNDIDDWSYDKFQKIGEAVQTLVDDVSARFVSPWKYNDTMYQMSSKTKKMKKLFEETMEPFKTLIRTKKMRFEEEKRTAGIDGPEKAVPLVKSETGFVELLLHLAEHDQFFNDEQFMVDNIITLILGAYETVATTISYNLVLLALHPEIQQRVYEEQVHIFGNSDRPVTYEDIAQMVYLDQIIKETLRLHPAVPIIARELIDDLEIEGCLLPKGAVIVFPIAHHHRDPKYWTNPNVFNPDNFSPDRPANPAYNPFSSGPRMCIGSKYAMINLKLLLSTVIRRYHVTTPLKITDLKIIMNIVLSGGYIKLNVHPRC